MEYDCADVTILYVYIQMGNNVLITVHRICAIVIAKVSGYYTRIVYRNKLALTRILKRTGNSVEKEKRKEKKQKKEKITPYSFIASS